MVEIEKLLDDALGIIGTSPLPDDAYSRIKSLEKQYPNDDRWGWIWEGYIAAGGVEPEDSK